LAVLVVAGSVSPSLAAEDSAKESAGAARAHFKQARTHYQLGEYRDALKEFKEAYRLKQDASFLYNIAQCHRQLGELSDAVKLYASYLREAPEAPNRVEVERQIRELKAAVEQQQKQQEQQAAAAAATPPSPPTEAVPGGSPPVAPTAPVAAPVPVPAPPPVVAPPVEVPRDAELEVIARPPEANILVNHISVGKSGPVKLRLPPGLYAVALEREGFRGAEGAVTLIAGDHTAVAGDLARVKTHGWRGLGHVFLVLGILSEGGGIVSHMLANRKFAGTDEFNRFSTMEKIDQAAAIGSATLAITCYVLDWAVNRGNVNPGPPTPLLPASGGIP
jgi:hypothetical protein